MANEMGTICAEGFSFFGKTNRLISHELKNIMAIISETLGLFCELLELSGKGKQLNPEKLYAMSDSVIEEVERANRIIRMMNAFAHSVDEFIQEVDINEALSDMIAITRLDARLKRFKLLFDADKACVVYTSPFFLACLLYHILEFALLKADRNQELRVASHWFDHGATIDFSGFTPNLLPEFPTNKQAMLARLLNAKLTLEPDAGQLRIGIPEQLGETPLRQLGPVL